MKTNKLGSKRLAKIVKKFVSTMKEHSQTKET